MSRIRRALSPQETALISSGVALVAIWLLVSILRMVVIWPGDGPTVAFDEWLYHWHAAALFGDAPYKWKWAQFVYPPLYPLLLSPAFLFKARFYDAMLVLNCLVYTASIFPAYGLARRIMRRSLALGAAVAVTLVPFPANVSFLMAENLAIPVFLCAMFMVVAGDHAFSRRWLRDIAVGAAIAGCFLTKFIMLPASIALLVFWMAFTFLDRAGAGRRVSSLLADSSVAVLTIGLMVGMWLAFASSRGIRLDAAIGLKTSDAVFRTGQFTGERAWRWIILYALYLGVVLAPFLPLLLGLAKLDWRQRIASLPVANRIRAAFCDHAIRFETLSLGFLTFYIGVTLIHDLSYLVNSARPEFMSSRYFEFTYPLLIIVCFGRIEALARAPVQTRLYGLLASTAFAVALVLFGLLVFRARRVFDISASLTSVQGIHTTTFSLWFNNRLFIPWVLAPIAVAISSFLAWRAGRAMFAGGALVACTLALAVAGASAWTIERGRFAFKPEQIAIAREVGSLLVGPASGQPAVVFSREPEKNPAIFQRRLLDLYGSFFSGGRYDIMFVDPSDNRQDLPKSRRTSFFSLVGHAEERCSPLRTRSSRDGQRLYLCPCTVEPRHQSLPRCDSLVSP